MTCDDVTSRLTAYIDGELDDATGSALRGHLRTCSTCHAAAEDELAVRDAMAKLPAPDVPPALWNAISAQLAAKEVADSKRSRWWLWWQAARPKLLPSMLIAGAAALAVIAYVRHGRGDGGSTTNHVADHGPVVPAPTPDHARAPINDPSAPPTVASDCDLHGATAGALATTGSDTAHVAGMAEAIDRCFEATARELLALVDDDRPGWPADRAAVFDAELDTARHAVTTAPAGRPRERAWQAVIQLLQRAVTVQVLAEATQ